jgi:hypothetical protein
MADFQEIEVNGEILEFPTSMTDEEISAAIDSDSAPAQVQPEQSFFDSAVDTAGDVGMQALGVAGGIGKQITDIGESVTSGFGNFPNPVSEYLGEHSANVEAASKDLGIDTAVKIGEYAPVGGVFGGGIALVGKIPKLVNYLTKSKKVLPNTLGRALKAAADDPKKIIALESAGSLVSGGADELVTEGTGSGFAGTAAGIVTGIATGSLLNKWAYGLSSAKEDLVDKTLANHLRSNPEALAAANSNRAAFADTELPLRLDMLSKDPHIAAQQQFLLKSDDVIAREASNNAAVISEELPNMMKIVTKGGMTDLDVSKAVTQTANNIERQQKVLVGKLAAVQDADTVGTTGKALFDVVDGVQEAALQTANSLYKNVNVTQVISHPNLKWLMKNGATQAEKTTTVKKGFGVAPVVTDAADALRREASNPTVSGLQDIRSSVMSQKRIAKAGGDSNTVHRLNAIDDTISKVFDLVDDGSLKTANTAWRTMKETFDTGRMATFFAKTGVGDLKKSPETFVTEFLTSNDPLRSAKQLFKVADEYPMAGVTRADISDLARQGYLAMAKNLDPTGAGNITPKAWGKFLSNNKDALDAYGLTSEFKNFGRLSKALKGVNLTKSQHDKMLLTNYAVASDPAILRRGVKNGKFDTQLASLPKEARPAFKRLALEAVTTDVHGNLLSPSLLKESLLRHGRKLVDDKVQLTKTIKFAKMLDVPKDGTAFKDLNRLIAKFELGDKLISTSLERITRPFLKVLRSGFATSTYIRNSTARKRLWENINTPEGIDRVLKMANKNEESLTALRALIYGRSFVMHKAGEEEGEQ